MTVGIVPLVATIASTAFSVAGQIQQAKAEASAANYNAKVSQRNAKIALQQGQQDAEIQRRKNIVNLGAMRASYGAAGVTAEGSPLDVLETSASNMELDRQTILSRARLRAMGYQDDAAMYKRRAGSAWSDAGFGVAGILFAGAWQGYSDYQNYVNPAPSVS